MSTLGARAPALVALLFSPSDQSPCCTNEKKNPPDETRTEKVPSNKSTKTNSKQNGLLPNLAKMQFTEELSYP
jgi:hypothetical protein